MNNNTNSNIQEPKICVICTQFYANPKFGQFCSKCYSEHQTSIQKETPHLEEFKLETETSFKSEKILEKDTEQQMEKEDDNVIVSQRLEQVNTQIFFTTFIPL